MNTTKTLLLAAGAAVGLQGTALAMEGDALFKSKPCAACHSVDARLVGPSIKEIAAKYSGQDDARAVLVTSITQGSQGKWGPMPMPPNAVTAEEAEALAEWVLSH